MGWHEILKLKIKPNLYAWPLPLKIAKWHSSHYTRLYEPQNLSAVSLAVFSESWDQTNMPGSTLKELTDGVLFHVSFHLWSPLVFPSISKFHYNLEILSFLCSPEAPFPPGSNSNSFSAFPESIQTQFWNSLSKRHLCWDVDGCYLFKNVILIMIDFLA